MAGGNTQVIFNDDNAAGASANLTFDKNTNILTVTGNISANTIDISNTANFSVASNVSLGNIANLHIDGGTANQVMSTDGAGILTFKTGSITVVGRSGNISIPIILS